MYYSQVLVLEIVVPMMVFILGGFLIKKIGFFTSEEFRKLGTMNFKTFIALTLFFDVYQANIMEAFETRIVIFAIVGIVILFAISWIVCFRLIKDHKDAATVAHGIYRGNYLLFGTSLGSALCTGDGVGIIAALAAVVIPLFNILSVILFTITCEENGQKNHIFKYIIQNPLVDAAIIGIIFNVLRIPIPQIIETPLEQLRDLAVPISLIALGGVVTFQNLWSHKEYLVIVNILKLIVVPCITVFAAILLGFRGDLLIVTLAIFATPVAVSSTPMAQAMSGNGALAGEIVASTSILCIFTIPLFVTVLSHLGFL